MTRRFTFTAALVATGCVDFSTDSIPCRTNANCPTGYGCTD